MFKLVVLATFLAAGMASAQTPYHSLGFNFSTVSGAGVSYRFHTAGRSLVQITAAAFDTGDDTFSSVGFEYQYELSGHEAFRYYIPVGGGLYTNGKRTTVVGAGFGIEVPILGEKIFEGVTVGGELFYPAVYFNDKNKVTFGGSVFLYYNF